MIAKKHKLNNFHIIIDYNKIQSYGRTKEVLDLEPLKDKLISFGYKVDQLNGHDIKQLRKYFKKIRNSKILQHLFAILLKVKVFILLNKIPFGIIKISLLTKKNKKLNNCMKD